MSQFKHYLVAACIETVHEVERLEENGYTLATAHLVPGQKGSGVFWSLYGYAKSGMGTCIGDFASREAALEVYSQITGCRPPAVPEETLTISLFAPSYERLLDAGSELATQVEQMKGSFDDADGAIEAALDAFEEVASEIAQAHRGEPASKPHALFPLVSGLYAAQESESGAAATAAPSACSRLTLSVDSRRVIGEGSRLYFAMGNFAGEDEQFSFLVRAESEGAASQRFTETAISEFGQDQDIEANIAETGHPLFVNWLETVGDVMTTPQG